MYWGFRPYVSVAQRRAKAARALAKLRARGVTTGAPVTPAGRAIAHSFWGKAWCAHLEKFSDYQNRLPRGRSYLRNGAVLSLDIKKGKLKARVVGSRLYDVAVCIVPLPAGEWKQLKARCAGQIGTALELLQGRLSAPVMQQVTDRDQGLFPKPKEMHFDCSCPDWADMCKHVAAVLYGVGTRLDAAPELLFQLRGVDANELVGETAAQAVVARGAVNRRRVIAESELEDVFGIALGAAGAAAPKAKAKPRVGSGFTGKRKGARGGAENAKGAKKGKK